MGDNIQQDGLVNTGPGSEDGSFLGHAGGTTVDLKRMFPLPREQAVHQQGRSNGIFNHNTSVREANRERPQFSSSTHRLVSAVISGEAGRSFLQNVRKIGGVDALDSIRVAMQTSSHIKGRSSTEEEVRHGTLVWYRECRNRS